MTRWDNRMSISHDPPRTPPGERRAAALQAWLDDCVAGTVTAPTARWPLTGRAGEMRLLAGLLARPEARGLVLAGPPGVGKTRLAIEALALAERQGLPTARASATRAAAALPFGAVAPLLPDAPAPVPGEAADRAGMLRQFAAALTERATGGRLVLLVDDAHLLDDASATLVHQLATAGTALLLLTVRVGEPAPDSVLALWKDGLLERLDVDGLDGLAVGELLTGVLDGPVDPAAVARLAAHCQGNVLYLRELTLGALASGALACDDGLWRLLRPLTPSARLVELIEDRLYGLADRERALMDAVAVGEPLSTADLAALDASAAAESLEAAGLLTSSLDGGRLEIRLAHPLHGHVLRARISGLRRRAIAATLGEALESTGARRAGDELRLAGWRLVTGGGGPELMLRAATTARRQFDYPLAERLARAAAANGAGTPAAVLAAVLNGRAGNGAAAEAELADLARAAAADGDKAGVGLIATARLENLRLMGRFGEALTVADAAAAVLEPGAARDELTARRAGLLLDTAGPAAGHAAATRALVDGAGAAPAWAWLIAGFAAVRTGQLDAAVEASEHGRAAFADAPSPQGRTVDWPSGALILVRAAALAEAGRLVEAEELAAGEHARAVAEAAIDLQAYAARRLAVIQLLQGRVRSAARHGREAAALLRELGRRPLLAEALSGVALSAALRAEPGAATEALGERDTLGLPPVWADVDADIARAWTAVAKDDVPTARALLERAADAAAAAGDRIGEATALHDLARLGFAARVSKRLRELAADIDGPLAQTRASHAEALAAGDPDALSEASAGFEGLGALLLAAEAAADAAAACHRYGEPRRAAAATRRAAALAERCEDATTPALRSIEARGLLTPAERQVAQLAAAGRSNRDIATALTLSLRTVENRLYRIYEKLGITGRADLPAALDG